MKCINHYIGGRCDNEANHITIVMILDGCGRPLVYCSIIARNKMIWIR